MARRVKIGSLLNGTLRLLWHAFKLCSQWPHTARRLSRRCGRPGGVAARAREAERI